MNWFTILLMVLISLVVAAGTLFGSEKFAAIVSAPYTRARDLLYSGVDRLSERAAKDKRRLWLRILLIVEILFILITFLLAGDKTEWAYTILANTPAGGVLNFFYNPNDFAVGTNLSAWLLSGTSFLMTAVVIRESEKLNQSKLFQLVHGIMFSLLAGAVCAFLVNHVFSAFLALVNSMLASFPLVLKLIPLALKLIYYLIGTVFLMITIRSFLDNMKALAAVLLMVVVMIVLLLLSDALLRSAGTAHMGAFYAIANGFLNFVTEFPKQHSFLAQAILTVFFTVMHNAGLVLTENVSGAVKSLRTSSREDDIIEAARLDSRLQSMSPVMRAAYKTSHPDEFENYEQQLGRFGSEELHRQAEQIAQQRDARKQKKVRAYDPAQQAKTLPEMRQLLKGDANRKLLSTRQMQYWNMPVNMFCDQFVPNLPLLDVFDQRFQNSAFWKSRLVSDINSDNFMVVSAMFGLMVSAIATLLLIVQRLAMSQNALISGIAFLTALGFWYPVFYGIARLFWRSKEKRLSDSVLGSIMLIPALWFSYMVSAALGRSMLTGTTLWVFAALILIWILFWLIAEQKPVRQLLLRIPYFHRLALKSAYSSASESAADELAATAAEKQAVAARKDAFDRMLVCFGRYDECYAYLYQMGRFYS